MRAVATCSRVALVCALLVVTGCAPRQDDPAARQLAERLVAANRDAGVAPGLTVDVAAAVYGTEAASVCTVFDGGLGDASDIVLLGNPAQGRRKTVTDGAVEHARNVVATYCSDVADDFEAAVEQLRPVETADR